MTFVSVPHVQQRWVILIYKFGLVVAPLNTGKLHDSAQFLPYVKILSLKIYPPYLSQGNKHDKK